MTTADATRDRWQREVAREFFAPSAVDAWCRWHDVWRASTTPLTDRLLVATRLEPGQRVLDIGSGTGDPALTIAQWVGPDGSVVATDPSPDMLAIVAEQAARAGLANLSSEVADVAALPFPDASFDRATCRLGVMYFRDPVAGLAEIRRILRPGGRFAALAWGDPTHASYAAAFFGPILSRITLPAPDPGLPNPYRFAPPETLRQAMVDAGFVEVEERIELIPLRWQGTAADYLRWFREVAIPVDYIWHRLGPEESERTVAEIVANLRAFEEDGALRLTVEAAIASGVR